MAHTVFHHTLIAKNTATASANKIHDDDVARRFGFTGGLVPGVTLFAWMARPPIEIWGLDWLARGQMSARFVKPVYNGEKVTIEAHETTRGDIELFVLNAQGDQCGLGHASLPREETSIPNGADYPAHSMPTDPPPAAEGAFISGAALGSLHAEFDPEGAGSYLEMIGENRAEVAGIQYAHPGWSITLANLILTSNFRLGPWIHVSSSIRNYKPIAAGESLELRGLVGSEFEKKGHRFVELDLILMAEGQTAIKIEHAAIYQPKVTV